MLKNLPVFNYGTKCSHIVITPRLSKVAYRSKSIKGSFEWSANFKEIQRALRLYLKTNTFADQQLRPLNSRRFFPEERDIHNNIYNATSQLRMSKVDQENVWLLIENWQNNKQDDFFLSRGYSRSGAADSTWHPFYNEHGDNIPEICLTTVLGFSCDELYRKTTIDELKVLYW